MRLLVCGSRNWNNRELLEAQLNYLADSINSPIEVVIEGEATGADTMAREWAESLGIPVEKYPANWGAYGRRAGPIRNKQMLDEGKPDMVYGFVRGTLATSRGTKNMLEQANKAGVRYFYIETGPEDTDDGK